MEITGHISTPYIQDQANLENIADIKKPKEKITEAINLSRNIWFIKMFNFDKMLQAEYKREKFLEDLKS